MTQERWNQVRTIFEAATERPEEERRAYVQDACGTDTELSGEVTRLLDYHSEDDFLKLLPTPLYRFLTDTGTATIFQPGDLVAERFRINGLLGYGGMGEVYEAEDTALPELRVALKTVRSHMVQNERIRRRLERELAFARQVTHPN